MRISLDGSTSEKHDYFRGVEGAFSKTTEAISLLVAEGISTTALTTVSKYNYSDIEAIIDLSVKLGADTYNTSLFYPAGRGAKRANWALSKEECKDFFQSLVSKKEQYGKTIDIKAENLGLLCWKVKRIFTRREYAPLVLYLWKLTHGDMPFRVYAIL